MKGQQSSSLKRQIHISNQILRFNKISSLADTYDYIKNSKTDSRLLNTPKVISKAINHPQYKQDTFLDLAFMTVTKRDSRYDINKFPNLEKKTDVQRVKWFIKQNKQIDQQQNFLEFLNSTKVQSSKNFDQQIVDQLSQVQDKNQQNNCNKYFVVKTPAKPSLIKNKNTSRCNHIYLERTNQYQLNYQWSQEKRIYQKHEFRMYYINISQIEFIEKNNELRRHCQTQQEQQYTQNSILEQLQIQNIQHINLYSSVKRGIKNDVLHNQYKTEIQDLIEVNNECSAQEYDTIQELKKKSIFQNPFSNTHHYEINQFNKQVVEHEPKVIQQNENEQNLIIQKRKNKIQRVLLQITLFLHWMIEHKLKYEDIISQQVFQTKPYQSVNSKQCFQKVKANDIEVVKSFITSNRYLVYDYDNFKLSMLHHAVIRDYPDMAILILQNYAEVNSKDIQGRTPLFYAIRGKCNQCVCILLQFKASPWGNSKNNYDKYLDLLDPKVRDLYKKAKTIHLRMQILNASKREHYWSQQKLMFIYK
ncbi:unnamed protein product (macronuclear) [Paramecium tetraurelia]|uniref:Uncharacterized protein n=1 Tax=Paramecium tetraurelia TaxID=5888 RepID=A0DBH6_PARTE|nr:uncharacterized protein GSPATT00015288001 [Paramecium tetraurelia]CAK80393.1 unnamed protein product [Paramecium tetraurelia]|eukprot:XP_001447790.1 hypothetical protein (macronuclear) [Paramecium tetraurelia strain d4-2]